MKIQKKKLLEMLKLLSNKINENFGDEITLDSEDYYYLLETKSISPVFFINDASLNKGGIEE